MVSLSTSDNVSRIAAADFRAGLSEEQRHEFQLFDTPAEMIQSLQEHVKKHSEGKRSRLLAGCVLIEAGCRKFEPYFDIVNILVQSHPEWAGIAWGVLLVSGRHLRCNVNKSVSNTMHAGKPGYGKTILCSCIIEDVRHRIAVELSSGEGSKTTAVGYFYFTNLQSTSNTGMAAF